MLIFADSNTTIFIFSLLLIFVFLRDLAVQLTFSIAIHELIFFSAIRMLIFFIAIRELIFTVIFFVTLAAFLAFLFIFVTLPKYFLNESSTAILFLLSV